ncbi:RagB/SusD family nutrient uptake outer membrane protein [Sediminitomix flava]|uniref:SusD-like starch-binding protein associating with outer membrane n=1 Tax=Sediminitomix flava TaxID=379075 RepID=A0A315ZGB1_SEDFL|nr:RagB/SusD family nutrient uptake outer membrane protein [Sediminitomix flava]PWJ44551.1 SusD-like starch-binding protein associating with outer membrane [Sediminitomix flava]
MKNKLVFILLTFSTLLTSCDSFLNRSSETSIPKDDVFEDMEGATMALTSAYQLLADSYFYRRNTILYPALKGGEIKYGKRISSAQKNAWRAAYEFDHIEDDSQDDRMFLSYRTGYDLMNRVNNIINYIHLVQDGSEAERNQILGEALTIRAIAHLEISKLYAQPYSFSANAQHLGIVTLEKTPDVFEQPKRARLYQTYDQIVKDLEEAITLMTINRSGTYTKSWLNKAAAQAFLSRVYLYQEDWNSVVDVSSELISSSEFSLANHQNYLLSWTERYQLSTEDLWVVDMNGTQAEEMSMLIGKSNDGGNEFAVTKDLIELFNEGDIRKELYALNTSEDTICLKFHSKDMFENFVRGIRLSEVYLNRAEAAVMMGDYVTARSDLNILRKRANPDAEDIKLSGQALIEEIYKERRRELALEGHAYYDIIRTGREVMRTDFNGALNQTVSAGDYKQILPIPDYAIEPNVNMEQNEGY